MVFRSIGLLSILAGLSAAGCQKGPKFLVQGEDAPATAPETPGPETTEEQQASGDQPVVVV